MRMCRGFLAAGLMASWLIGCDRVVPTSPTRVSLADPVMHVVSGIASETVGGNSRPLADRTVLLWVSTPGGGGGWAQASTDRNGRYMAHVPPARVFVTAWHPPDQHQPCLASAAIDGDTTLDVHVVPTGSTSTSIVKESPLITGIVYETTAQGRMPLRGIYVSLDALPFLEVPVATTQTDETGRFVLCRVNAPVGLVVSGNGYQPWSQLISGTSDASLDIELRR